MGVIKRQGIASGIFVYIGVLIGFVNTTLLFPKILGAEVLGFTQVLVSASSALGILALMGQDNVAIRYFPYFKDKAKGHHGFLPFLLFFVLIGLSLAISIVFIFKSSILGLFSNEHSQALTEEYYLLLPLMIVSNNLNLILISYSATLLRTRIPTFLTDVFRRVLTLIIILLFFYQFIDVSLFLLLFVGCYFAVTIALVAYVVWMGQLFLKINLDIFKGPLFKEMVGFGFFSILSQLGAQLINKVDMLMLGAMVDYRAVGIYVIFYFIARLITMPHNGIGKIAKPLIAGAWKDQDVEKIQSIYQRTALNSFIVGALIFIGIWVNIEHALTILGEEYYVGKYVAFYLGIAQLIHIVNGYNMVVLINSPSYKLDIIVKLLMSVLTIVTNYVFITKFGVVGAGMATALTLVIVNLIVQFILFRKYQLHPFSMGMLKILGIGAVTYLAGALLPSLNHIHFLFDLGVRSFVMTLVFGGLVLYFNISSDINGMVYQMIKKIRK